jgi:hypothetical protein
MRIALGLLAAALAQAADETAADIMAKVAANFEQAADGRRQYLYNQSVRSTLTRSDGIVARRERRQYLAIPGESRTEKKLEAFYGEYLKGKQMVPYSEPGYEYKNVDIDGNLIDDLTDDLVSDNESRDGIPEGLFPLRAKDLPGYEFSLKGATELNGRRVHHIAFEPRKNGGQHWKGEAWIDAAEYQPVRIDTHLAWKMPWAARIIFGTNLRQTGFSVTYTRVADGIWFPHTYGTEFRIDALFAYKRVVSLSLENKDFRRGEATSKIEFDLPD